MKFARSCHVFTFFVHHEKNQNDYNLHFTRLREETISFKNELSGDMSFKNTKNIQFYDEFGNFNGN